MNESEPPRMYDIFSGTLNNDPLWIIAVSGLSAAINVMNRTARVHPGSYFVFDTVGRTIVAQTGSNLNRVA